MNFVNILGVKVDVDIPKDDKRYFSEQWQRWIDGITLSQYTNYTSLQPINLKTKYEHVLQGSGVGIPPDPFKSLAAQSKNADLEKIIKARKSLFSPNTEYTLCLTANYLIPNLADIINLSKDEIIKCTLTALYPEISDDGRIAIPKIIGVTYNGELMALDNDIIRKIKLPTTRILRTNEGTDIKECFDYDSGYRLELVRD